VTGATAWPDCAFWDFSLALYARPGIEAICLMLQDDFGLDVNLVLLAAWTASRGTKLAPDLAARLRSLGEGYQATVMQPCRAARRGLRGWPEMTALGDLAAAPERRLRALELDLERLEQLRLAALVESRHPAPEASGPDLFRANLEALYPGRALPEPVLETFAAGVASLRPKRRAAPFNPICPRDSKA
jgi:uncharacterized protein (TIGR02444 family)